MFIPVKENQNTINEDNDNEQGKNIADNNSDDNDDHNDDDDDGGFDVTMAINF